MATGGCRRRNLGVHVPAIMGRPLGDVLFGSGRQSSFLVLLIAAQMAAPKPPTPKKKPPPKGNLICKPTSAPVGDKRRRSAAPSEGGPRTKKQRVTAKGRVLLGPDVWYSRAVATSLPMPARSELVTVAKLHPRTLPKNKKRRHEKRTRRIRPRKANKPREKPNTRTKKFSSNTVPDWNAPPCRMR
ncbi:hypothetical protein PRIC2_002412 [Phytophthora ramorum]